MGPGSREQTCSRLPLPLPSKLRPRDSALHQAPRRQSRREDGGSALNSVAREPQGPRHRGVGGLSRAVTTHTRLRAGTGGEPLPARAHQPLRCPRPAVLEKPAPARVRVPSAAQLPAGCLLCATSSQDHRPRPPWALASREHPEVPSQQRTASPPEARPSSPGRRWLAWPSPEPAWIPCAQPAPAGGRPRVGTSSRGQLGRGRPAQGTGAQPRPGRWSRETQRAGLPGATRRSGRRTGGRGSDAEPIPRLGSMRRRKKHPRCLRLGERPSEAPAPGQDFQVGRSEMGRPVRSPWEDRNAGYTPCLWNADCTLGPPAPRPSKSAGTVCPATSRHRRADRGVPGCVAEGHVSCPRTVG